MSQFQPNAVTNLQAVAVSQGEIALSWTNNNPGFEQGSLIERSVGLAAGSDPQNQFQILGTVASDVSTFADTTTTSGTFYQYRVTPLPCQNAQAPGSTPFVNPKGVIVSATTPGVMRYLDATPPSPYGTGNQFSYSLPLRTS
jgi:hypothetical protein